MITQAGLNRNLVLAALWGRMVRKELETNAENLTMAISKQIEVPLDECVKAMVDTVDDTINLTMVMTIKKPEVV